MASRMSRTVWWQTDRVWAAYREWLAPCLRAQCAPNALRDRLGFPANVLSSRPAHSAFHESEWIIPVRAIRRRPASTVWVVCRVVGVSGW
ncbi:hypothetical protein Misp05_30180 [Micromonospora sp. NBRC 107095]|nr:hypothetical protein Misp05_30180 [Micromonospora sp. NBRC 107095]